MKQQPHRYRFFEKSAYCRFAASACCSVALILLGAAPAPNRSQGVLPEAQAIARVDQQIRVPETRLQAIQLAMALMRQRSVPAAQAASKRWLPYLASSGSLDAAIELSQAAIISASTYPQTCESILTQRIGLLEAAGRREDALVAAKSLYNIATTQGTAAAIQTVSHCLDEARQDGGASSRKFRYEQAVGTNAAFASSSGTSGPPSELSQLQAGAEPYLAELKRLPAGNTFERLAARGNLYLLANRPDEAIQEFDRASKFAVGGQYVNCIEGKIRCERAKTTSVIASNLLIEHLTGH